MTCPIDHSDPEAIPQIICRHCGSPWQCEPTFTPSVAPRATEKPEDWPFEVKRDNLTPRDIEVMRELTSIQTNQRKAKSYTRVSGVIAKIELKDGARWDARNNRWTSDGNITQGKQKNGGA